MRTFCAFVDENKKATSADVRFKPEIRKVEKVRAYPFKRTFQRTLSQLREASKAARTLN